MFFQKLAADEQRQRIKRVSIIDPFSDCSTRICGVNPSIHNPLVEMSARVPVGTVAMFLMPAS